MKVDDVVTSQDDGRGDDDVRGRRFRSGLVAAGAAAGLTLAGLGVAAGQTDGTTTEPPTSAPAAAPAPAPGPGALQPGPAPGGFHPDHGPGGPNVAMGPGIHGEFTTRAPGGGYQTIANQQGEVTAVSSSSITVKSEDGYSRTYAVNDKTMVSAGNEGIADVATGDRVHVTALVVGDKASAVMIHDGTKDAELRRSWAPAPPPPSVPALPAPPAPPTPPTTTD